MKPEKGRINNRVEILIAEDSPGQAARLKHLLEQRDFRVFMANNGEEALSLLHNHKPVIVISDVVMPKIDGYELCQRIKAEEALKNIPVILLTVLAHPRDVMMGLECGADSFITKPFDEDYLLSRIEYFLANRSLHETTQVQTGLEVTFAGRKYSITSDRLQILNLLLSTYETALQKNRELTVARDKSRLLSSQVQQKVLEKTALSLEIEERRMTERKLRLATQEWLTTFDSISDWVSVHDKDFKVVRVNKAFANHLKMTPQEIIGRRCYELMHGEKKASRYCCHREVLKTGQPMSREFFDHHLDAYIEVLWSPVFGDNGDIAYTVHVARDITQRKKAEEELCQLNQELETFAYTAAHDLKAPLITIQGFAALLRQDLQNNRTNRVEEDIRLIDTGISKMLRLLKTILEYGRTNRLPPPTEKIPFGEVVTESLAQAAEQVRSAGAKVSVAETFPEVVADRVSMVQALNNLIVNATRYRDKTRPLVIDIGLRTSDGEVVFYVRDNGTGISPGEQAKVFEAFYRGSNESEGTGLGLNIVKRVIERHGGRVWLESEPGKGTTVCFTLSVPGGSRGQ